MSTDDSPPAVIEVDDVWSNGYEIPGSLVAREKDRRRLLIKKADHARGSKQERLGNRTR